MAATIATIAVLTKKATGDTSAARGLCFSRRNFPRNVPYMIGMEKKSYRNMAEHVRLLGWIYIIFNLIGVLVAGVVFLAIIGGGLLSGDAEAIFITSIVGTAISGFVLLVSAPGIIAGVGLLKRKSWARILALILGFLNLLNFPLGTALGVYTIWVLMQEESALYFATAD